jgi:hypothetical protein
MKAVTTVYAVVRATRSHTQIVNLYANEPDALTEAERYNKIMRRGATCYTVTSMSVYQSDADS